MIAYKALKPGNIRQYQGYYGPVPQFGEPGQWVEASGELGLCSNGIHGYLTPGIAKGQGPSCPLIYEMELEVDDGETILRDGEKACGRRGRLLRLLYDQNGAVIQPAEMAWQ